MDTKRQAERASGGLSERERLNELDDLKADLALMRSEFSASEANVRRLEAQLAGANGTNARWMAATGCATPEEWEAKLRELCGECGDANGLCRVGDALLPGGYA